MPKRASNSGAMTLYGTDACMHSANRPSPARRLITGWSEDPQTQQYYSIGHLAGRFDAVGPKEM